MRPSPLLLPSSRMLLLDFLDTVVLRSGKFVGVLVASVLPVGWVGTEIGYGPAVIRELDLRSPLLLSPIMLISSYLILMGFPLVRELWDFCSLMKVPKLAVFSRLRLSPSVWEWRLLNSFTIWSSIASLWDSFLKENTFLGPSRADR